MRWFLALVAASFLALTVLLASCKTVGVPAAQAVKTCAEAEASQLGINALQDFNSVLQTENWSEDAELVIAKYGWPMAECVLEKLATGAASYLSKSEPDYEELMVSPRAAYVLSRHQPADAGSTP